MDSIFFFSGERWPKPEIRFSSHHFSWLEYYILLSSKHFILTILLMALTHSIFSIKLCEEKFYTKVFFVLVLKMPIQDHATSHIKYLKPSRTPTNAALKLSIASFQQQIDNYVILHGLIITPTWCDTSARSSAIIPFSKWSSIDHIYCPSENTLIYLNYVLSKKNTTWI